MVAATLVLLCTKPLETSLLNDGPWLLTVPSIAIIGREVVTLPICIATSKVLSETICSFFLSWWRIINLEVSECCCNLCWYTFMHYCLLRWDYSCLVINLVLVVSSACIYIYYHICSWNGKCLESLRPSWVSVAPLSKNGVISPCGTVACLEQD